MLENWILFRLGGKAGSIEKINHAIMVNIAPKDLDPNTEIISF